MSSGERYKKRNKKKRIKYNHDLQQQGQQEEFIWQEEERHQTAVRELQCGIQQSEKVYGPKKKRDLVKSRRLWWSGVTLLQSMERFWPSSRLEKGSPFWRGLSEIRRVENRDLFFGAGKKYCTMKGLRQSWMLIPGESSQEEKAIEFPPMIVLLLYAIFSKDIFKRLIQ